jgi:hypothetical protein
MNNLRNSVRLIGNLGMNPEVKKSEKIKSWQNLVWPQEKYTKMMMAKK